MFFVGDLRSYASSRVQPIDVAETWQFRGKRNVLLRGGASAYSACSANPLCLAECLGNSVLTLRFAMRQAREKVGR